MMAHAVSGRVPVHSHRSSRVPGGMAFLASLALSLASCSTPAMLVSGGATAGVAVAQERGPTAAIDDNAIAAGINQRWLAYDWRIFRDVSTSVSEGRVMLTGKVARQEDKDAAAELTWQVGDVRQVYNEIEVTGDGDIIDYTRDTWISTQLKTDLTFDQKVRAINYDVVTVGGVIYLLGIAQDQDEINRVMEYARNLRYVRGVVSHVLLKDDPNRYSQASNEERHVGQ